MYQPQLIEVDPRRIKFNQHNPRKHGGEEYEQLKQSIQEIGIIQPPIVRIIPGGFYELIDGEGRVSIAQDLHLPKIWVANMGTINSEKALSMLVTSNTVRQFDFFARCRGMAALHRQGKTAEKISRELGIPYPGMTIRDMSIGYFPDDIHSCILSSIQENEDKARVWSNRTMLYEVLSLRQRSPEKIDPRSDGVIDGAYDYSEVKKAIDKIAKGDISNGVEMRAYVEQRRRELFEQHFNQELDERLQSELEKTKQALEEANSQTVQLQLQSGTEDIKRPLINRIATLQAERDRLEQDYTKAMRDVAKHKDNQELIDAYNKKLSAERQKAEQARIDMEREMQVWREQGKQKELERERAALARSMSEELSEKRRAVEQELADQRKALQVYHQQTEADLKKYYSEKSAELEIKAKVGVRDSSSHGVELIAQLQQWLVHITSEDMIKGLSWLPEAEIIQLVSSIRAVHGNLEEAEEKIAHGKTVTADENAVDTEPTKFLDERQAARW
jgi:ParB-like nuclease domain